MKGKRKAISFILVLALVLCSYTTVFASFWPSSVNSGGGGSANQIENPAAVTGSQPASASNAAGNAAILWNMGLFRGTSPTMFQPDLESSLSREQGITLLLRIMGLEHSALEMTDTDVAQALRSYTDAGSVSDWAKKQVAYAVAKGLVKGTSDTALSPKSSLNGKAYSTMILRQLGYAPDYNNSINQYSQLGGLSSGEQNVLFGGGSLNRGQLAGISLNTLTMPVSGGSTPLIQTLISKNVVKLETAQSLGFGSIITAATAADNANDAGSPSHHHSSGSTDTTPPTFTVTAASITGGDTITLDFSEAMNTTDLISVLNAYQTPDLSITYMPIDTLDASTVWTDSDTLKITLIESTMAYILSEHYVGVMIQARDTAGLYTTSSTICTSEPVLQEHQGPLLTSWSLTSGALTLIFDEVVDCSTVFVGGITVENHATSPSAFYTLTSGSAVTTSGYSKNVSISLSADDVTGIAPVAASAPAIYIELPAGIEDLLGNPSLILTDSSGASYAP